MNWEETPLRKEIMIYLAENGPENIRQVSIKLEKTYKSTWESIDALKDEYITSKPNTKAPKWWLTAKGVQQALILNADYEKMKQAAPSFYNGTELQKIIDICNLGIFPPSLLKIAVSFGMNGKLSLSDTLQTTAKEGAPLLSEYFKLSPNVYDELKDMPGIRILMGFLDDMAKDQEE